MGSQEGYNCRQNIQGTYLIFKLKRKLSCSQKTQENLGRNVIIQYQVGKFLHD